MAGHRIKGKDYSDRPWKEIRRKYETGQAGPKALSELYGIPYITIRSRAYRKRWIRNKVPSVAPMTSIGNTDCINTDTLMPADRAALSNRGAPIWGNERIDRLLQDLESWVDSWEGGDPGVTIQHFCKSRYNSLGVRATQITYLFTNDRFIAGMERLRPLVADRIATLTWTLKNGKSAPMGIFWLKQFGWTDRQDIRVEHSGQSLEQAISRAYGKTTAKLPENS